MRSQRGFLLIAVMSLLIIVIAMIGWCLQRATFTSHAIDLRIESYRDHHEVQGLKAIVARWFSSRETRESLSGANTPSAERPEYRAELPNHTTIVLHISDGQSTILARLEGVSSVGIQELLLEALRNVPPDRGDLIRKYGPPTTSLAGAPREVLLAFAGGDSKLADVLMDMQTTLPHDNSELVQRVMSAGYPESLARDLTLVLSLNSVLSRVDGEVTDERGTRRYALLVGEQDGLPRIYECRRLEGREEILAAESSRPGHHPGEPPNRLPSP